MSVDDKKETLSTAIVGLLWEIDSLSISPTKNVATELQSKLQWDRNVDRRKPLIREEKPWSETCNQTKWPHKSRRTWVGCRSYTKDVKLRVRTKILMKNLIQESSCQGDRRSQTSFLIYPIYPFFLKHILSILSSSFFSGGAQPTHVRSMLHSKDMPEELYIRQDPEKVSDQS